MMASFGIHFGCTSVCLAVYKDGQSNVVANDIGERTTPAVVAFTDHDVAVGLAAKQGLIRNSANTICNAKVLIGKACQEKYDPGSNAKIINRNDLPEYEVEFQGKIINLTPTKIAAKIFSKMMETAQSHGGAGYPNAVITVPVDFTFVQRDALRSAAEQAGFCVLRIISEPSAAALAYDLGQHSMEDTCHILVARFGGYSLNSTVIKVSNGMYQVMSDVHSTQVCGGVFTQLLHDHFAAEFTRQWKVDIRDSQRAVSKLWSVSERCKHVLSTMSSAPCHVESLYEGIDFQSSVTRARFDMMIGNDLLSCKQFVKTALEKAKCKSQDIAKVVVCGGSSRIPAVQKMLQDIFPNSEFLNTIPPDEVIAVGAAKQAAILSSTDEDFLEADSAVVCLSTSLQVQLSDGVYQSVFAADTPVPARCQKMYALKQEQTNFKLQLYAPEFLGQVVLSDLPGGAAISVVYHTRRDGSCHITCYEKTTGKSDSIVIEVEP